MAAVEQPCEICKSAGREEAALLCDDCDATYHMDCLSPPLDKIPDDEWFCPTCLARRVALGTAVPVTLLPGQHRGGAAHGGRGAAPASQTVPLSVALGLLPPPPALAVSDDEDDGDSSSSSAEDDDDDEDITAAQTLRDAVGSDDETGGPRPEVARHKAGSVSRHASAAPGSQLATFNKAVKRFGASAGSKRGRGALEGSVAAVGMAVSRDTERALQTTQQRLVENAVPRPCLSHRSSRHLSLLSSSTPSRLLLLGAPQRLRVTFKRSQSCAKRM
jgi:hypothetical protein